MINTTRILLSIYLPTRSVRTVALLIHHSVILTNKQTVPKSITLDEKSINLNFKMEAKMALNDVRLK